MGQVLQERSEGLQFEEEITQLDPQQLMTKISCKVLSLVSANAVHFSRIGVTFEADFAEHRSQWDPGGILDSGYNKCKMCCRLVAKFNDVNLQLERAYRPCMLYAH